MTRDLCTPQKANTKNYPQSTEAHSPQKTLSPLQYPVSNPQTSPVITDPIQKSIKPKRSKLTRPMGVRQRQRFIPNSKSGRQKADKQVSMTAGDFLHRVTNNLAMRKWAEAAYVVWRTGEITGADRGLNQFSWVQSGKQRWQKARYSKIVTKTGNRE